MTGLLDFGYLRKMKIKCIANIISIFFISVLPLNDSLAHPGETDPVLEELNDYLMAIQLLRLEDPRATEIFALWHQLRTASWKIRELTDEQDFLIHADEVMKQIGETKKLRLQLLHECRDYFSDLTKKGSFIQFTVDKSISGTWTGPALEVQVEHFEIILIEVVNNRNTSVHISLHSDSSDEILFWDKQCILEAGDSRFTFAICSPLQVKEYDEVITIRDTLGKGSSVKFQAKSIPMQTPGFTLKPGESGTKVTLPGKRTLNETDLNFTPLIKFSVHDKATGKRMATRIEVRDSENQAYWSPIKGSSYAVDRNFNGGWRTPLWEFQPGPFFYIDGNAELGVSPKNKFARIYCGFEYNPVEIQIPDHGNVDVAMERWINMPELGWYSGQTHIHTTNVGIPVHLDPDWAVVTQGEDLHVSAILTLKGEWQTHAIYANEFPMGIRTSFSTPDHIITYGEEFRNNPYGHLVFMGLKNLIQPISTGALGELGGPDYPPNSAILEEAVAQGATTIAAHFGNFTQGVDSIKTPWPSTGFEMPVDIALGNIQLAEIYGNGGQKSIWYDILNCGFKIAATAGPDWTIKDSPRVYVDLGQQPFTLENWRKGLEKGRSFITKGPMLFFEVDGKPPGSILNFETIPAQMEVIAEALLPSKKLPVEIIYNGKVIANTDKKQTTIAIRDSGWIAVRCDGAHSNPIYIQVSGRPAGYAEPAERFIEIIDRLAVWVKKKGLFDNDVQKKQVLQVIDQGKSVYLEIRDRARSLNRKL